MNSVKNASIKVCYLIGKPQCIVFPFHLQAIINLFGPPSSPACQQLIAKDAVLSNSSFLSVQSLEAALGQRHI